MKVFINGCFDVIHIGHFNILMFARELATSQGKVIVAIDEDEKIMADKKRMPIFSSMERSKAIYDLRYNGKAMVDEVTLFHTNLELEMLVKKYKPDFMVKGTDWIGNVVGEKYTKVIYFDRISEYSSTEIIRRCQNKSI